MACACRRFSIDKDAEAAELAISTLQLIAQNNSQTRQVICSFNGIRAFVRAAGKASPSSRRDIAALFAEVMILPKLRDKFRQAGGLLVLLQFHRNRDPEMRVHTEKALHYFGDMLDIYFTLAQDSLNNVFRWERPLDIAAYELFVEHRRKKAIKANPMVMMTEPEKVKERARKKWRKLMDMRLEFRKRHAIEHDDNEDDGGLDIDDSDDDRSDELEEAPKQIDPNYGKKENDEIEGWIEQAVGVANAIVCIFPFSPSGPRGAGQRQRFDVLAVTVAVSRCRRSGTRTNGKHR